ncbi:Uncharacterised protein [uncultured archaeon]|nr:Uncharacterised protein [uncultured archaeon]
MTAKYIYIDESGGLGKFGSKYFTVVAIVVDEPKELARVIKKLRERKLKKGIKEFPEIKANNSNKWIREYVLGKVRVSNCGIFAIVVKKDKIHSRLFEVQNRLYNYLCGVLLSRLDADGHKFIITIDKKYTNALVRENFDEYVINKLKYSKSAVDVEVYHLPSHASNELQVVDFVVWSINRKFNAGDSSYYNIIESKITNKEQMLLWEK